MQVTPGTWVLWGGPARAGAVILARSSDPLRTVMASGVSAAVGPAQCSGRLSAAVVSVQRSAQCGGRSPEQRRAWRRAPTTGGCRARRLWIRPEGGEA
ncbi:hypothetical protein FM110_09570 [Brachybacterium nesterenkovii]|uniref:Uncharacterized protein n=1 Tax=Brachybacterium nesterenkovii TaxID=47847 RepID=A0A1X6X3G8_9MICO|nr:hypothetical protein FM110_09570 [Brachybacterium nesterenkovii]